MSGERARAHESGLTSKNERGRHSLAFVALAAVWLCVDQATKAYFESTQTLGAVMQGFDLGLLQFRLVHNTGAAWSAFSGMTFALGVVSTIVCLALAVFFFKFMKKPNWWLTIGLALVFAGGIGNAIDRFARSYVVDFIETTFIDFPVFNIADIGVTCGIVLAAVGMLRYFDETDKKGAADGE